ncbi:response regulator [Azospirillum rugosum]|uniref:Two-component system response regulator n=1 Tax=Azospirillum rugosum TaxID=416170 RepID=A0ABS4SZ99_9PROT|nr:response regulator [Azospirillum rugosum]MBP2297292.1 putative two-component system response regulator [Azospirillum rugosum]MDQ0531139.1 putative two-component system response regulator [Azospirillum rugosum]
MTDAPATIPADTAASKPTVLVVDDTPDNLKMISALLKDAYRLKVANNGAKALEIAAGPAAPDLILLDIVMPGLDGHAVCERLKGDPRTRGIPVIFMTGRAEAGDRDQGLRLGAADYLTKPIDPTLLRERVAAVLARQT